MIWEDRPLTADRPSRYFVGTLRRVGRVERMCRPRRHARSPPRSSKPPTSSARHPSRMTAAVPTPCPQIAHSYT